MDMSINGSLFAIAPLTAWFLMYVHAGMVITINASVFLVTNAFVTTLPTQSLFGNAKHQNGHVHKDSSPERRNFKPRKQLVGIFACSIILMKRSIQKTMSNIESKWTWRHGNFFCDKISIRWKTVIPPARF